MPGYVDAAAEFRAKGVDEVIVYCVNDGAVMQVRLYFVFIGIYQCISVYIGIHQYISAYIGHSLLRKRRRCDAGRLLCISVYISIYRHIYRHIQVYIVIYSYIYISGQAWGETFSNPEGFVTFLADAGCEFSEALDMVK